MQGAATQQRTRWMNKHKDQIHRERSARVLKALQVTKTRYNAQECGVRAIKRHRQERLLTLIELRRAAGRGGRSTWDKGAQGEGAEAERTMDAEVGQTWALIPSASTHRYFATSIYIPSFPCSCSCSCSSSSAASSSALRCQRKAARRCLTSLQVPKGVSQTVRKKY